MADVPHSRKLLALAIAALAMSGVSFLASSCGDQNHETGRDYAETASSMQERLAQSMITGIEYDEVRLKAERYDPERRVLYDVQVTSPSGLLAAARAEIKVNLAAMTAQLTLFDVVTAPLDPTASSSASSDETESEPDHESRIVTYDRLDLEPFSIRE